jgi:hypothetical protein
MRLDGATLSFFISIFIYMDDSVNSNHSKPSDLFFLPHLYLPFSSSF